MGFEKTTNIKKFSHFNNNAFYKKYLKSKKTFSETPEKFAAAVNLSECQHEFVGVYNKNDRVKEEKRVYCVLYSKDLVIVSQIKSKTVKRFNKWQKALEKRNQYNNGQNIIVTERNCNNANRETKYLVLRQFIKQQFFFLFLSLYLSS